MSIERDIEKCDAAIERMIGRLEEEYDRTGILSSPTDERKKEIIDQIAKLRASITPKLIFKLR